jgi:hypothetical protein
VRTRYLLATAGLAGGCLLAGCGSDGDEEPAAASTSAAATSAVAAPTGPAGGVADGWPAEAPQALDEPVFAIYLAVAPEGSAELVQAGEYVESLGYSTAEPRRLGCDEGAAEALRRDPDERAVAVYFEWRADAGDFTALHKDSGLGFVEILHVARTCEL